MKLIQIFTYLLVTLVLGGCASTKPVNPVYEPTGNNYTSAYPTQNISEKLSRIQNTVQRIISTATYKAYYFNKPVTVSDITPKNIADLSTKSATSKISNAGTAISILKNNSYTLLITANHVTASPDTIYTFKKSSITNRNQFVQSISIKTNSEIYLFNLGSLIKVEKIAQAPNDDLALLIANNNDYEFRAPTLSIRTGTAKNLQLGSVIYVLGYPLGNAMITQGIVSSPNYDGQGSFLTDALFNHGISGGLIIASSDQYESFEWVGMVSSTSVKRKYFLIPRPDKTYAYHDFTVYTDRIYIDQMSFINYGVSTAIPIEDILEFLYHNENKLNKYRLSATGLVGQ